MRKRPLHPWLIVLACSSLSPALACPPNWSTSTKTAVDLNGPPLEVGDLVDWTIEARNSGCTSGSSQVHDLLDRGLEFVAADHGGVYDPVGHKVEWSAAEVGQVPVGGSVSLLLSTRVASLDARGRVCNQARFLDRYPYANTDDPATSAAHDSTCLPTPRPLAATRITPCRGSWYGGDSYVIEGSELDEVDFTQLGPRLQATITARSAEWLELSTPAHAYIGVGFLDVLVRSPHSQQVLSGALLTVSPNPTGALRVTKAGPAVHLHWDLSPDWTSADVVQAGRDKRFECADITHMEVLAHTDEHTFTPPQDGPLVFLRLN